MSREILRNYKLIYKAKYKHKWDTLKFMNVIAGLFQRERKELERYLELHAKS